MAKNKMLVAFIEEYKKAAKEYCTVLDKFSQANFEKKIGFHTKGPDCTSIKSITYHVLQAGYGYVGHVNSMSNVECYEYDRKIESPQVGITELNKMLRFTETSFSAIWDKTNTELETWRFKTRWKETYSFEQLMEHAIVHILRHRRQIENMIKENNNPH
jgi:uncharacterized damage-inducible protein DinB